MRQFIMKKRKKDILYVPHTENEETQEKEKEEFITDFEWLKRMLSHNVRMPMSIITGYGELLRQGLLTAEEQKQVIEDICENIYYMNEVLRVVLEDGKQDDDVKEQVDLVDLLMRTKGYIKEVAKKIPIHITMRTEKPHMYIQAPPLAIMRIFYQLFENAVKYLNSGDSITIQIYYVGEEQILVTFKDDGQGMAKEEVKSIFDKGFRGSNSVEKPGSGYGLSDVKTIVEKYGWSIKISSDSHTGFSVFLMFPVYKGETRKEGV